MRKNFGIFLFAGLLSLFASCNNESDTPALGKGSFNLSLSTNTEVVPVLRSTAGTQDVVPSEEDFQLTLSSEDGQFSRKWSSINSIDPEETYDVGNYVLKAEYGSLEEEGFLKPYFVGETTFTIRDRETADVNVMCALGHVKFTLNYTEAFKKYFTNYQTVVCSSAGRNITITKSETRDAYLRPGNISLELQLTKSNGVSATFRPEIIKEAKAREHHIVTLDVSENVGEVFLNIIFGDVEGSERININVSDEAMTAPAPYIVLDGVSEDGSIEIQECSAPANDVLSATITARGGLKSCTLTTHSTHLQSLGFPENVELTSLTAEQVRLFETYGLEMRGFGENRDEMAIVNFATLTPSLLISDNGDNEHTFTLTATDQNDKLCEPVSFTVINTPLTLTMGDVADVMMGSTSIDIPVTFDGSDASRLQIMRMVGNTAQALATTIKSNEGNNYVLTANFDVENKSQELFASFGGIKNTESQVVGIIVPAYTLNFAPADVWHNRASFTVKATDPVYQSVVEKYISFYINSGSKWEVFSSKPTDNVYSISGLAAGSTYQFNSSCLADGSDLASNTAVSITTEAQLALPNPNFDSWTQWFSEEIDRGGKYAKTAGLVQERQVVASSNPDGWATVNAKTVPTSPKTKNTWYMVPSTLPTTGINGNAVMMRNVAWDNNGNTPPAESWGHIAGKNHLDELDPPSIGYRSAGKLFLGSYSYNHSNNSEVYNEGISFVSRPAKLTGYYKYTAQGNDTHGIAIITVEHRTSNGQVITLATTTQALSPVANFTQFEIPITYTNKGYKATHLRVMFASSNYASTNQASETQNIVTVDNRGEAVSLGSELCVDNLSLIY